MNAEQVLRKYFGLVGDVYTEEWKSASAIKDDKQREAALDSILENDTIDCKRRFTREAWELWGKALRMLEAMAEEGYIGDGKNGDFYQFFWETMPD